MSDLTYNRIVDIKRLQFIKRSIASISKEEGIILDVGCGNGLISHHLGALGYKIHGIDISKKAIDRAISLNKWSNVHFFCKSAEVLENEGQLYDAIICSEVLEHLENPVKLLRVLHTLLKDDGVLIVTVPHGMGPREVMVTKPMQWIKLHNEKLWGKISSMKKIMGYSGTTVQSDSDDLTHIHFFTKNDLLYISKTCHYKIIEFEKSDFIEDVFPVSLLTKRSQLLQKLDCKVADLLPHYLAAGFHSTWVKAI